MSPTDANMPGIKGKRIPGRPGRFDPTEPLHMTTRRAAKTGPNNGSPSINGSIDGDESRRSSLDDLRPLTSHSNGGQFSVKSRRESDVSLPLVSPEIGMNGLSSSDEKKASESISKPLSPSQQTPSPTLKRKRSSSPVVAHEAVQPSQPLDDIVDTTIQYDAAATEMDDEGDAVELVPPEDLSDREISQHSFGSEEDDLQHETYPAESMDVTPAISNPGSPESGESESRENAPLAESLGAALEDIDQEADDDVIEAAEDMDIDIDGEGAEDAEDADDGDDAEEQLRSDDDERPRRRFGGRRRAQHPIAKVEKAMQRQAEIKSMYRALARVQKAALAEIALRTIDDLDTQPELHTQTNEYQGVKDGLENALEERQYHLRAQLKLNMEKLQETLEAQQRALDERCMERLRDLKEDTLTKIYNKAQMIGRQARKDGADSGYLTEDEDDLVSRSRPDEEFWRQSTTAGDLYDSRSRLSLRTVRANRDMERRFEMHKLLKGLEQSDEVERADGFTIMNELPRNVAIERRAGRENANILAEAAAEYERVSNIPVIRNEDALGLQLLGDLASRPSITAPTRDPAQAKSRKASQSQQTPSRPIPPQIQIPTNYRPSPIPVEMSPRTTQALGDRFESSMPPPITPRQRTTLYLRSPEAVRPESSLPSPTFNANPFNTSQEYQVQTPERWAESRRANFSDYNRPPLDGQKPSEQARDAQFSPNQSNERRVDYPLWREYPREPPAFLHRRASSSHSERPPFNLGAGLPLREETQSNVGQRFQERQEVPGAIKSELSPHGQLHNRPPFWQERPSRPGAIEGQSHDQRPPNESPRRPAVETHSPPHSRAPSISFTPREFRPSEIQQRDNKHRQKHKAPNSAFQQKTSREERDGMSRRDWSHQRRFSKPMGGFGSAGSPTNTSSAGSPVERTAAAPWRGPPLPQHSPPAVPPPPVGPYQQSQYSQPPPPSNYRPTQPSNDYYRSSFTPRPASSNQDKLPPTPLYSMPSQHPPPPGVPPDQYNRPFAPPPPPGYQPPPPPAQAPGTPYAQSAPGNSFTNQFGGTPLAPAGANSYHSNFRPAPAFAQQAQQQQQQGGAFGNRRRTQSDASNFAKFQSWKPPAGSR